MANCFTMTNHDLHCHMGFCGFVFSLGVGLLSGYLTYLTYNNSFDMLCNSINRNNTSIYYNLHYRYCTPPPSSNTQSIQAGINAGISLTVIGGVLGFCSCIWLGQRLKVAEQTFTTRT